MTFNVTSQNNVCTDPITVSKGLSNVPKQPAIGTVQCETRGICTGISSGIEQIDTRGMCNLIMFI